MTDSLSQRFNQFFILLHDWMFESQLQSIKQLFPQRGLLDFENPSLEEQWDQHRFEASVAPTQRFLIFAATIEAGLGLMTYLRPQDFTQSPTIPHLALSLILFFQARFIKTTKTILEIELIAVVSVLLTFWSHTWITIHHYLPLHGFTHLLSLTTVLAFILGLVLEIRFVVRLIALATLSMSYHTTLFLIEAPRDEVLWMEWYVLTTLIISIFASYRLETLRRSNFRLAEQSEALIQNILPPNIATQLKTDHNIITNHHPETTVMFVDLVGFTAMAVSQAPQEVVHRLNHVFSACDTIIERHGLKKIKTIGDCYMGVAGLPDRRDDHATATYQAAEDILRAVEPLKASWGIQVRIGIHSGEVIAGVLGKHTPHYDVWGDTVNVASRLESHGEPGSIHLSATTYAQVGPLSGATHQLSDLKGRGTIESVLISPHMK